MSMLLQSFDTGVPSYTLAPETMPGVTLGGNQYQCDLRINRSNSNYRAISLKTGTAETTTSVLSTTDGGATWTNSPLTSSGDPDVVYDNSGVLHLSFINKAASNQIGYRRSTDSGVTWSATTNIGAAVDHPHIATDRTTGTYGGSIYTAGRAWNSGAILVNYSRNGGLTWTPTTISCTGALAKLGSGFVYGPVVMPDGTLVIPATTSNTILADANGNFAGATADIYALTSIDGGQTFSINHVTAWNQPASPGAGGFGGVSNLGVGSNGAGGYRLYQTYVQDINGAGARLMLTTSDDKGITWTTPVQIAPTQPTNWGAGSCSVMVNKHDIIGVQYFDIAPLDASFDMYFVYSKDYGATFSQPVRLTTGTSPKSTGSQPRYFGQDQVYADVDASGNFHTVWPDGRNSTTNYTVYSRIVTVN